MELNDLEKIRYDKILRMRAAGTEPYPTRAHVTHTTHQARHRTQRTHQTCGHRPYCAGSSPVVEQRQRFDDNLGGLE